jgi:protein-tyrosine phosphatase
MRTPAVLMVCLGNICRSPLAEAALRAEAAAAGVDVVVDSAGTGAWHIGEPPDPRARAVARAQGLDISGLRGRQVSPADFDRFDHVVALDRENLRVLEGLRPAGARARLNLLLDHVPGREGEPVADPYFGGPEGFEVTLADARAGARGILGTLRENR